MHKNSLLCLSARGTALVDVSVDVQCDRTRLKGFAAACLLTLYGIVWCVADRYGKPSADDNDVHKSAEAASIHQTITERFPKHYDTVVGELGMRLSGSEKQRVAFARALLRNPLILLLDEATSSLDSLTEKRIQDAMEALREQRTTIIVAHRLSTIMDADVIVVLRVSHSLSTCSLALIVGNLTSLSTMVPQ